MLKVLRRLQNSRQVASPACESEAATRRYPDKTSREKSNSRHGGYPATDDLMLEGEIAFSSKSLERKDGNEEKAPAKVAIVGGGIIGLLMALALEKHTNVKAEIYEQANGYAPDVGAGMGLYANGLRVIQDVDPELLKNIQEAGCPYGYRRWERHDGTEIAVACESVLGTAPLDSNSSDADLQTMGIRRWRLQQALHAAVQKKRIPLHFGKEVLTVNTPEDGTTEVIFTDGSRRQAHLLIAADGGRSAVRSTFLQKNTNMAETNAHTEAPKLNYTGVTCLMGVSENTNNICQGISFPVSTTTQCHGAFYPTGSSEQCFQFHFPIVESSKKEKLGATCTTTNKEDSCWGNLSQEVSGVECRKLAGLLEADGWDEEKYLRPLRRATKAVRVGFCQLEPALKCWSFPNAQGQPRTILIGDAAHPPVPYIGQGAQQGMEDVGTLALLLKAFCLDEHGEFDMFNLGHAVRVYEKLRIPRVKAVLATSNGMGTMQQKRAQSPAYNIIKEETIQRDVFFHETMPIMLPGARYDYKEALEKELKIMAKQSMVSQLRPIVEEA